MYLYTYTCLYKDVQAYLFLVSPWQIETPLPVRIYDANMELFSAVTTIYVSTITTYTYTPASIGTLGTFNYSGLINYPVSNELHDITPVRIEFGFLRLIGKSLSQMTIDDELFRGTPQQLLEYYINYIQTKTQLDLIHKPVF